MSVCNVDVETRGCDVAEGTGGSGWLDSIVGLFTGGELLSFCGCSESLLAVSTACVSPEPGAAFGRERRGMLARPFFSKYDRTLSMAARNAFAFPAMIRESADTEVAESAASKKASA